MCCDALLQQLQISPQLQYLLGLLLQLLAPPLLLLKAVWCPLLLMLSLQCLLLLLQLFHLQQQLLTPAPELRLLGIRLLLHSEQVCCFCC